MFEKFKQLRQLQEIKDSLEKERIRIEKQGVVLVMNGRMEIEEVRLNPELNQDQQEIVLKECFNEAIKKIQRLLAQKMMQM